MADIYAACSFGSSEWQTFTQPAPLAVLNGRHLRSLLRRLKALVMPRVFRALLRKHRHHRVSQRHVLLRPRPRQWSRWCWKQLWRSLQMIRMSRDPSKHGTMPQPGGEALHATPSGPLKVAAAAHRFVCTLVCTGMDGIVYTGTKSRQTNTAT